jgi:cell division protein FtsL
MRPLFYYLILAVGVVVIGMFFVGQRSRHVQIGYELTRLRKERATLMERGDKLNYEITQAGSERLLAQTARQLGLQLKSPESSGHGASR